jgi:peptide/nickel transport system permease protein
MKPRGMVLAPLIFLVALHLIVLLAGFFSPYDFARQERDFSFAPPTRIHWLRSPGHLLWHPVVYRSAPKEGDFQAYEEDPRTPYEIHLLPAGTPYSVAGLWTWNRHLFGVDLPAHIWLMGTDGYGRDLFSRLLYAGRISLFAGLLATLLSLALGVSLGTLAAFYGSWPDALVMRCVDVFMALPWLYLLLALRAFLPLHIEEVKAFLLLIAVIGILGWGRPARLVRGVVLSVKEGGHILAARSFGASKWYLLGRHILPETREIVLTQAAVLIPQYVLAEVTLSFLGLGVGEPVPSLGSMLASLQQYHVLVSKWWMFFPGLVLIPVFLSYGLMSNALQRGTEQLKRYIP